MRLPKALAVAALIAAIAGCGTEPEPPAAEGPPPIPAGVTPGVDWFGNPPSNSDPVDPDNCQTPGAAATPPHVDREYVRAPSTPAGHNWVTYGVNVLALAADPVTGVLNNDVCVPVHVTISRKATDPDSSILGEEWFDFWTTTPWNGTVSFDYDPTAERYQGRPPGYSIVVDAVYVGNLDRFHLTDALTLGCIIRLDGAPVAGYPVTPGTACYANHQANTYKTA